MMRPSLIVLATVTSLAGCEANSGSRSGSGAAPLATTSAVVPTTSATAPAVAQRAEDVRPLQVGAPAPDAALRRPDGTPVDARTRYAAKPSVVVFYRGGWCPYCNTHLGKLATAEPELVKLGYQVLAVSPDAPEALQASLDKGGYKYQLLSDSDMALSKAFGLAFRVDDPTVKKYEGFGIDLAKASGRDHHLLPVPAVYLVDQKGNIRFAHWNPDYKKRLDPNELLDAARRAAADSARKAD